MHGGRGGLGRRDTLGHMRRRGEAHILQQFCVDLRQAGHAHRRHLHPQQRQLPRRVRQRAAPGGDSARPVSLDSYEFDEKAGERSLLDIHSELIGKLDIKALRHFKDGINTALDGAVESSNYNPFVMAFCALGVALNEVFVPENLLDIAPSKPLNLIKKGASRAAKAAKAADGVRIKGAPKERNTNPRGIVADYRTRKKAREKAQRAGKGKPVHHYNGEYGHHYHPGDGKGNPLNHDHYYYGRRKKR